MPQVSDQTHQGLGKVTLAAKHDTSRKMLGAEWSGKHSVTVNERDVPMVTDPVSGLGSFELACLRRMQVMELWHLHRRCGCCRSGLGCCRRHY